MKIGILISTVPFVRGGAEILIRALHAKLREYGHQALLVRIPFRWEPPQKILEHMLACRLLRMPGVARVVALNFPAFYVPHEDKIVWMLHQFRPAYDLWKTPYQGLSDSPEGQEVRDFIVRADNSYLAEASRIFANSEVTSARLKHFNGFDSDVLHPPLPYDHQFSCIEYGDYIFAPGNINEAERQLLLVQSMAYCRSGVKLLLAGKSESKANSDAIKVAISKGRLEDRVTFLDRFISEEEKVDWFGRALACAYIPYDEDSYGYVTLESLLSKKALITCNDSGGIRELVKDKVTGRVVDASPRALAEAMDGLYYDRAEARQMGEAGYGLVKTLDINWDHVVRVLTA